jgi:hypothetical protein
VINAFDDWARNNPDLVMLDVEGEARGFGF